MYFIQYVVPAVAPKRGYYLGMRSEALGAGVWRRGEAAMLVPCGTCVLERDDEGLQVKALSGK